MCSAWHLVDVEQVSSGRMKEHPVMFAFDSTTLWGHILHLCLHLAEYLKCLLKEADYVGDVKASICCGPTGRSKIILKQPT